MSWMQKLYETYEQIQLLDIADELKPEPVYHSTQNAHINIILDGDGNFKRAMVLEKTQIVLPSTEKSAAKAKNEAPHALAEKIHYVAGDYAKYGGKKNLYFPGYKKQLKQWVNSKHYNRSVQAVYTYIQKEKVVEDLINYKILLVDETNKLRTSIKKNSDGYVPPIIKVLPGSYNNFEQGDALVCWTVEDLEIKCPDTWRDKEVIDSWIDYNTSLYTTSDYCYVSGDFVPTTIITPAKIRHSGDKAKLISSNDKYGFTFRGKFTESSQSAVVGSLVTQKAHNALRWLIKRQGYRNDDQVILAWAVSHIDVPQPIVDSETYVLDLDDFSFEEDHNLDYSMGTRDLTTDLGEVFAKNLRKKISGYREFLNADESVVILALDSATPGRMGITFYQEFFAQQYLDQLSEWYEDFSWYQRAVKEVKTSKGKKYHKVYWNIRAPYPRDILHCAYGNSLKSTESLKKNLYERLLPCITERKNISLDIVRLCIKNASTRYGKEYWEWERNIGVACSVYRGFLLRQKKERRIVKMSLNLKNTSRDYLYGRLLAVAEKIERVALDVRSDSKRLTSAEKLMHRFADHPYSTWLNIVKHLQPYMQQLQSNRVGFLVNRKKDLDSIMDLFEKDDFISDKALSGEFLLGFHCQRLVLNQKSETEDSKEEQE